MDRLLPDPRDPSLDVLVVEANSAGFGASGRNGGWCSALLPQGVEAMARRHGRPAALAMRRAMVDTVREVGDVVAAEQIDCDFRLGGTVVVARNPAQLARARAEVEHDRAWDGIDGLQLLDAEQTREHIGVDGAVGATYTPHCARIQPAKLARGLADVVERSGVRIVEGTRATSVSPRRGHHRARPGPGPARAARHRGLERALHGHRREVVPVYSLIIATEPLPQDFWAPPGWRGRRSASTGT